LDVINYIVARIFAMSFEIIIQRGVANEPYYVIKNTLIITVLYNRSRKNTLLLLLLFYLVNAVFYKLN
jgi:hypothetical protein